MSEQPTSPAEPTEGEASHASVGGDVARAGGGRTEEETAVDEAMGGEENPGTSGR
jgi:hypothetical protein